MATAGEVRHGWRETAPCFINHISANLRGRACHSTVRIVDIGGACVNTITANVSDANEFRYHRWHFRDWIRIVVFLRRSTCALTFLVPVRAPVSTRCCDFIRFLAGCRKRQLNQVLLGLVVWFLVFIRGVVNK